MRFPLVIIATLVLTVTPAAAVPPDVTAIVQQMKAALEPVRPSTQKLTIFVRDKQGESTQWVARQARKKLSDGNWVLTELQVPESLKGITYLVHEQVGQPDRQWVYLPALRRVREIMPLEAHQAFLGTDFTYADLGFINLRDRKYKLLGMERQAGVWAYKVQEILDQRWYYSRIVTWVAADSSLPLKRDYYDSANRLWKIERFQEIKRIDGVPTSLWMTMEDLQEGSSSTIEVSEVRYDADVPDVLFNPGRLPEMAASPVWQTTSVAQADHRTALQLPPS